MRRRRGPLRPEHKTIPLWPRNRDNMYVRQWTAFGMRHRDAGPAMEFSNGGKEWWQGGERIYFETGSTRRDDAWFPGYDIEGSVP